MPGAVKPEEIVVVGDTLNADILGAHKAGMHVDAVRKNPQSFEHVSPDAVGNQRRTAAGGRLLFQS